MMYGLREAFTYFRCVACDCLQIAEIPSDLSRFYPPGYYSFEKGPERYSPLRRQLVRARNRYAISGRGVLGRMVGFAYPYPWGEIGYWLERAGASTDSDILDVGCGTGELLHDLALEGFRSLLGVDPFIRSEIRYPGGARILKGFVSDVAGRFDVVMLHHALEHIPEQRQTLETVASLLRSGGHCLIRVPVVPSHAWDVYRENWVQIDAPRHLFIHSPGSLELLAGQAGLKLIEVRYDSNELQFFGSELYRRDIALVEREKPLSAVSTFRFRRRAARLNAERRGDQAAFLFVRT